MVEIDVEVDDSDSAAAAATSADIQSYFLEKRVFDSLKHYDIKLELIFFNIIYFIYI